MELKNIILSEVGQTQKACVEYRPNTIAAKGRSCMGGQGKRRKVRI
jgi:hypothetical protein